ncbi:nucleoside-diphosphate kinase [Mytilus galloprovincialis]|uniref:Nucleoside diphosphate kinase n=1 Tax=Mytilus galloprovincialis TaxID=29158 RepID=A0A8B6EKU7_MYTGA|nr:nucleoside-diphosphate kinase [Mytilus galloprovincialis]
MAANNERSFIMVKPDGVQRGLTGEIIKRFNNRGYKLVACKLVQPSKEFMQKHYADLSSKPFFNGLVEYMSSSGPVCACSRIWENKERVPLYCKYLKARVKTFVNVVKTNPLASAPGTIRGDYCVDLGRNICHGSDAVESAKREIDLWFKPEEVITYSLIEAPMVYE